MFTAFYLLQTWQISKKRNSTSIINPALAL